MCNIAGYIGLKDAAPILAEMMKKQEGFGGGYYTGITTHDGKNMHSCKVIGDMQNLLNETDFMTFPGTMGFLHSRSKSGGGVEWGQPYTSTDKKVSYIANGAAGIFGTDDIQNKRCERALYLEKLGFDFKSRVEGVVGRYPHLSDGSSIHSSDIMCQDISNNINNGDSVAAAMSKTFSELPVEAVGLVIYQNEPNKIFVTRVNYPMMIGVAKNGDTYLATTALAFPDDVEFRFIEPLPHSATCEVYRGGYRVSPHQVKIDNVASITPDIWQQAYANVVDLLSSGKKQNYSVQETVDACEKVWKKGTVPQGAMLVYKIMRTLKTEGRLGIELVKVQGAFDGYTTNNFCIYLK